MNNILLISLYEDISSIGVRYLSSYLRSAGKEVNIIHLPLSDSSAKYINKLDSKREIALLIDFIRRTKPDLIGISLMTNYFRRAVNLSIELKKHCSTPIVFGGIHPTLCPEECLEFADIVCIGEAEETLLELSSINNYPEDLLKIKGIAFRYKDQIIKNEVRRLAEELDKYPFPDYSFENDFMILNSRLEQLNAIRVLELLPRYPFDNPSYKILTARGCPYSCSYCCNYTLKKMWKGKGRYLRGRSVENIIAEIVDAADRLSFKSFKIMDDSFLFYPLEWIEKFNKEYKAKVGLPFGCLVNPLNVDYDKLKLMVDCGLEHIQIGLESGSDRINYEIYKRKVDRQAFLSAIDVINSLNPRPHIIIDVIVDNPFETTQDKMQTVMTLTKVKKPFQIGTYSLTYYPKTGLYDLAKEKGYLSKKLEKKIYQQSFYDLEQDYMSGLILLTNKNNVPAGLIEFLLKYRLLGYVAGTTILKTRNSYIFQKVLSLFFRNVFGLGLQKLRSSRVCKDSQIS